MKSYLVLENGNIFEGERIGYLADTICEVVFNTSMTGYLEIFTDPSYSGQGVVMTYPLIGNYGINRDDFETIQPVIKGIIVKEVAEFPSNWRNERSLAEFLEQKNIPGIAGIDTRMLTRHIRENGTMKGAICGDQENLEEVLARLKAISFPQDEVKQVAATKPYPVPGREDNVVVVDFGIKHVFYAN